MGDGRDRFQHWFQPLAEHVGSAYLRYSFTKGTEQEVAFLWDALGLEEGSRVLDVGCGPGRHSLALARRGAAVTGVDISEEFIGLARAAAGAEGLDVAFEHGDARALDYEGEFDAVVCLCQGAFGLPEVEADDQAVFAGAVRALRRGGRLALSAFSSYFVVCYLEGEPEHRFDAAAGVHHEVMTTKNEAGEERRFEGTTSCWTPRELRLLATAGGLVDVDVYGVTPGGYAAEPPDLECPEFLLLATRSAAEQ